ncbi:hypothetical protein D9M69_562910 [compost metagenome]
MSSMMRTASMRMRLINALTRGLPWSLPYPAASSKNFWTSAVWEIFTVILRYLVLLLFQRSSEWIEDGWRHSPSISMSMYGNSGSCISVSCSSSTLARSNTL